MLSAPVATKSAETQKAPLQRFFPGNVDGVPDVSRDLFESIFSKYLATSEIPGKCRVSRTWNQCLSNLWKHYRVGVEIFPGIRVISPEVWKRRVPPNIFAQLKFKGSRGMDKRTYLYLNNLRVAGKAGDARFTVLDLPEGHDFDTLIEKIAKDSTMGPLTPIEFLWEDFLKAHGKDKVTGAHTVVIIRGILEGSDELPFGEKKELVSQPGCELEALKVATLCVFSHKEGSPLQFYTCCSNELEDCRLGVGFGPAGLSVYCEDYLSGAGTLRKL